MSTENENLALMDEAVLYFGSPDVRESAQRQLNAQLAAERYCIEQDRKTRSLTN